MQLYYECESGVYEMKDFGNDDYTGDCFALVGRLHGLECKTVKEKRKEDELVAMARGIFGRQNFITLILCTLYLMLS